YPPQLRETIVVLDDGIAPAVCEELRRHFPGITWAAAPRANYLAHKNAGVAVAQGSVIAFVDSDCHADPEWLEMLVTRFQPDVVAVAGHTNYRGNSLIRTFSIPDFNHVVQDGKEASGFNLSNV